MDGRLSLLFAFAVSAALLVVGCDSAGSSSDDPPQQGEEGSVSLALARAENSGIPSDADSAFVRIWQPDGSFNLSDLIDIPDPGQQTEVSFDVPSGEGYRTGILAVTPADESDQTRKKLLAHGSSDQFTVMSDDTSQVALDLRPADLTLEAPESLAPNQTDTIEATYQLNPPDANASLNARQGSNPTFDFLDGSRLNRVGSRGETDTTQSQRFEIAGPNVENEDTTFVKVRVFLDISDEWTTADRSLDAVSVFPSRRGPSFEIPVVPGSGDDDGTVVITFSRDEDGWERTRRVVE